MDSPLSGVKSTTSGVRWCEGRKPEPKSPNQPPLKPMAPHVERMAVKPKPVDHPGTPVEPEPKPGNPHGNSLSNLTRRNPPETSPLNCTPEKPRTPMRSL